MRVGNCNLFDDNSNFGTVLAPLHIYPCPWFSLWCDNNWVTGHHFGRLGPRKIKTDSAVFSLYVHNRCFSRQGLILCSIKTRRFPLDLFLFDFI